MQGISFIGSVLPTENNIQAVLLLRGSYYAGFAPTRFSILDQKFLLRGLARFLGGENLEFQFWVLFRACFKHQVRA